LSTSPDADYRLDTPIDLEVDAGVVPVDATVSFAVSFT